jgi:cytochrome c oxidase subunit II
VGAVVDTRAEYSQLFSIYVPIALGVFAAILIATVFALWRYRARPGRAPSGRADAVRVEGLYVALLAAVAALLIFFTFRTEAKVDPAPARPGLVIEVVAAKWNWRFAYAGRGVTVLSTDRRPAAIVVPTRTEILLRLRSEDVIHSFYVPATRIKKDIIPGAANELGVSFPRPGSFGGECAEFCGLHHAEMLFSVRAVAPAEFRAWLAARRTGASG